MAKTRTLNSPGACAGAIRKFLKHGGSEEHAAGVQSFFKEEIRSHGWYTAALRRAAVQWRRALLGSHKLEFLLSVADRLFTGRNLEEKVFAVLMLEKIAQEFGDREFSLFESWLNRISSWADYDGLVHYLIAPMIYAEPKRMPRVFRWAKSSDRWHRRAACVALIHGVRRQKFFGEVTRLSGRLLADHDDMVQKGLGWLVREAVKASPRRMVPYLMRIRSRAPRLVLRTACETLASGQRARILTQRLQ